MSPSVMDKTVVRNSLGILMNTADLLVAGVLVLGGRAATNSHPVTGYITMAMAPVLLYLSSGIWTKQNWKLITRLLIYAGAALTVGVSAAVLVLARAIPMNGDTFAVFMVIGALFAIVVLSAVHLRIMRRSIKAEQLSPTVE